MTPAQAAAKSHSFPNTAGALRESGYVHRSVKQELRENAIRHLRSQGAIFPDVFGYDHTVLPQLLHAVLSRHDFLLLGLRGQAKTRLLRASIELLDEWIPVIDHPEVELPDDPLEPTTAAGRRVVESLGEAVPVRWLHRSRRYHEKLATPDVTIADLIGEIDIIKHAEGRHLSDEATMHFGLIPRSNRGIFVINELPDLAPRIQVGLFNVLEERDVQIRGYPVRLDLDICLMFSANPEDYTNRGRIVTPLKDRIGSVVRTHYPRDNEMAMRITRDNAFIDRGEPKITRFRSASAGHTVNAALAPSGPYMPPSPVTAPCVRMPRIMHEIIEEMVRQARKSTHVNQASGVSVRASIAAIETLISAAELRALRTGEQAVVPRVCDTGHLAAALRGKIELMIAEESPDGAATEDRLIDALFGEALKSCLRKHLEVGALDSVREAFEGGIRLELTDRTSAAEAVANMKHVSGLLDAARKLAPKLQLNPTDEQDLACAGELVLEFLYVNNRLSKISKASGPATTGYMR